VIPRRSCFPNRRVGFCFVVVVRDIRSDESPSSFLLCRRPLGWKRNALMAVVSLSVLLTYHKSRTEGHRKLKIDRKGIP